jgi:hypothetical protein
MASVSPACPLRYSLAADAPSGGWTCPVCFFYCQAEWLVCPVCDYVRPADLPMDDAASGSHFSIVGAARGLGG